MRTLRAWACVALVVAGGLPSAASARTYTLREAVVDAMTQSDAVAAAEAKSDRARSEADEALLMFFPQVEFTGGFARLDTVPYVEQEINFADWMPAELLDNPLFGDLFADLEPVQLQLEFGRQNMWQFQLQGEQILFAGTALHRQRAMKLAQLRSTREEARAVRHDVALEAEKIFWRLALARRAVEVAGEGIETASTHVGLLEQFVVAGLASDSDLMAAKVQLSSLRFDELRAIQGAELAESAFRMIVQVPAGEAIELDTEAGAMPFAHGTDLEQLTELARDSRPEMKVLEHQFTATRHGAGAAWSSWLPAIALMGNVYLKNPDRANEDNFYWSADVSVGMSWKLWDRGQAIHRNRQARAGMREIEAYRRQLRDGIKLEIEQALGAYREADRQMEVAAETVALADENLRLAQLNFGAGVVRNVDVMEAQTMRSKARLDALTAETRFRTAEARLRRAVGEDQGGE